MKKFICRVFGHKYDFIERMMFSIEAEAINRNEREASISCQRCGHKTTTPKR